VLQTYNLLSAQSSVLSGVPRERYSLTMAIISARMETVKLKGSIEIEIFMLVCA